MVARELSLPLAALEGVAGGEDWVARLKLISRDGENDSVCWEDKYDFVCCEEEDNCIC